MIEAREKANANKAMSMFEEKFKDEENDDSRDAKKDRQKVFFSFKPKKR